MVEECDAAVLAGFRLMIMNGLSQLYSEPTHAGSVA